MDRAQIKGLTEHAPFSGPGLRLPDVFPQSPTTQQRDTDDTQGVHCPGLRYTWAGAAGNLHGQKELELEGGWKGKVNCGGSGVKIGGVHPP